jgi:hypothetical protein
MPSFSIPLSPPGILPRKDTPSLAFPEPRFIPKNDNYNLH